MTEHKRLTERDEFDNADIIGVSSADIQLNLNFAEFNRVTNALNKLADYEDAEETGTLVRLPCKVGDTVYIKGVPVKVSGINIENEITYYVHIDCYDCGDCPFYEDENSWEGEHDCKISGYLEFTDDDIGKTVFLTREEAEKALTAEKHLAVRE